MRKVKKTIDINAHIQNITCHIESASNNSVATIGFYNLGYGTITAIKFYAKGYNAFGDVISINGKESFFLIIQDIFIEKNTNVENLKANLPNSDIRKLDLKEAQICYSDGSVVSYESENYKDYELEEYEYGSEGKLADALKEKYGYDFRYKPMDYPEGWICGCGRWNRLSDKNCSKCGVSKENAMNDTSEDGSQRLLEQYLKIEEQRAVEKQKKDEDQKKKDKKKKIYLALSPFIAIIVVCFIIRFSTLAKRSTYASELVMKTAVNGTYTYSENGYIRKQIRIDGSTMTKRWNRLGSANDVETFIKEWEPNNGTIQTDVGTLIVSKNGNIIYGDEEYVKGGHWSDYIPNQSSGTKYPPVTPKESYSFSGSSNSYESGYSVLKIQDVKVTSNSSYTICTGSVKNTGTKTYKFVTVKGAFKDSQGNVLDTDSTYAVGSEGLAPNETSTFYMSVSRNSSIRDCSVSLLEFK